MIDPQNNQESKDEEQSFNAPSEAPIEDNELVKCKKEKDEYLDGWQRAKAEFINYKKDEVKRFETLAKFANESIIRDLINILDSFDLAVSALEREASLQPIRQAQDGQIQGKQVEKGVYLIRAQLEDALKNYGLERVIVSIGNFFDPAMQEAVAVVESDKPTGTVVEEIERGYMLNGKLIRPSRVKVAR